MYSSAISIWSSYGTIAFRFKIYCCRFISLVADKRFERAIEFRWFWCMIVRITIPVRSDFFSPLPCYISILSFQLQILSGAVLGKLFGLLPFVSQSLFSFLCHVRNILFPCSLPFDWRVLISNTFKKPSSIIILIVSITKFVTVIGSPHTYLSSNWRAITWVSNYRCPIWTFCNWILVIGYLIVDGFLRNVFYSFQDLGKALQTFSLKRNSQNTFLIPKFVIDTIKVIP